MNSQTSPFQFTITVGVLAEPGSADEFMQLRRDVMEWLKTNTTPADGKARYLMELYIASRRISRLMHRNKLRSEEKGDQSVRALVERLIGKPGMSNVAKMKVSFRTKRDAALFRLWFSNYEL